MNEIIRELEELTEELNLLKRIDTYDHTQKTTKEVERAIEGVETAIERMNYIDTM